MRPCRFSSVLVMVLPLALAAAQASAGGTRTEELVSYEDFDKGQTEGAAIESSGKVTVGFIPARAEITASAAFSCLAQGKSVLVGTADEASIRRVFPGKDPASSRLDRKAAKQAAKGTTKAKTPRPRSDLKVESVAQMPGVVVSAMAALPGGDVLAAALPGGTIHRVDKRGKRTKFAELKVDQIWALAVHGGRVLAATGPKGELWSIATSGKDAKVALDVDEKDLLSLAVVGTTVVVGTAPHAQLFAVTGELGGVLLHDFSGDEVRAIAVTDHGLAVAVNAFEDRKISSVDALTKTLDRTSLVGQPPTGNLGSDDAPSADASVHYVDLGPRRDVVRASEAPWEEWLSRKKQYFTSILALEGETVLVSSSAGGKIYRVRGPRDAATVTDLDERQATALCRIERGPVFATTAHGAGTYQLRAAAASKARYRTRVFDAKQPAAYGSLVLRGSRPLTVWARVGPSEDPDERWSKWTKIKLLAEDGGLRGSMNAIPHRRFLQLEVALGAPSAALRSLEYFFAPENLAPLVRSIAVKRPDLKEDEEPASDVTIKWKVDARDDDDLMYDVRVRPEGTDASQWIKVTSDDELTTKSELKWDITTVPDGVYEVGVTASDEPSNGSANARTDELVSEPFVVDRQRPVLSAIRVDGLRVRARATDSGSYIHDVTYSIDGAAFRVASSADGLFDSPSEDLAFDIPEELSRGRHRLVIRCRDSFGNIGSAAIVISR